MNFRKTALGIVAIVILGSALGGCVIVPVPYGHGGGGGYYHYRH